LSYLNTTDAGNSKDKLNFGIHDLFFKVSTFRVIPVAEDQLVPQVPQEKACQDQK